MSNAPLIGFVGGIVGVGALGLLGLGALAPHGDTNAAPAADTMAATAALQGADQAAFRAEVRSYLMDNPEVLMEAIGVLEQRQAEAQSAGDVDLISANAEDLYQDKASWVGGNPDGDITIVEFLDYRCGYCRKAHSEVADLLSADGNIRLIVKEFPILGEASMRSSQFAVAVKLMAGDEMYKAVHEALITLRQDPSDDVLAKLADSLGIDGKAAVAQMGSPEVQAILGANHALGQRMQINGTPTFVMGDQMIRGYLPLEGMKAVIAEERG